jgi:hypothetical protein
MNIEKLALDRAQLKSSEGVFFVYTHIPSVCPQSCKVQKTATDLPFFSKMGDITNKNNGLR